MTETEKLNIYQRLAAVAADIPGVVKGKKAPDAAGGYAYAGHDDIQVVVNPVLVKHGVKVLQDAVHMGVQVIEISGKPWLCDTIQMVTTAICIDNPEDKIHVTSWGRGLHKRDLGPGIAQSYARKYGYIGLLGLRVHDPDAEQFDNGSNASQNVFEGGAESDKDRSRKTIALKGIGDTLNEHFGESDALKTEKNKVLKAVFGHFSRDKLRKQTLPGVLEAGEERIKEFIKRLKEGEDTDMMLKEGDRWNVLI